ncbi:MAG: putative metalloprotease CJM1_0395 family protein [Rheinheimera sp.]
MAITSIYPNVSPYIGNPGVDLARRENLRRDIIEPVAQAERGAAEKGVLSEDKSRNNSNMATGAYAEDARSRGTELKQAVAGRNDNREGREGQNENGNNKQETAEQRELAELKKRDAEVKAHEAAHAAVGGQLASAPSYSFEVGPDGQQYAVAGEVQIDLSPVPGDPQATIIKMQQVKAAALAPAEPSAADRQVAAEAARRITAAQAELAKEYVKVNEPPAADGDYDALAAFTEMTGRLDLDDGAAERKLRPEDSTNLNESTRSARRSSFSPPESRSLEIESTMQLRNEVIAGFYARATVPAERPLLQTA